MLAGSICGGRIAGVVMSVAKESRANDHTSLVDRSFVDFKRSCPCLATRAYSGLRPNSRKTGGWNGIRHFSAVALAILLDGLVKYARASILGRLAAQAEYELSFKTAEKLLSIDENRLGQFSPGRIRELFTAINRSNDVLIGQSTLAVFDAPFAITFLVLVWFLGGPTVFGPLAVVVVFGALALFSAYRQAKAGKALFEASAMKLHLS